MLEELRIKCPSCGIILEVKNSGHEAVKRIVCPNCKKTLAVDFQEKSSDKKPEVKPFGTLFYGQMPIELHIGINKIPLPDCKHVEIEVVRLIDGNSKCIVRPLSDEFEIEYNDYVLSLKDKVALTDGDILKIGSTVLVYGHPSDSKPEVPPSYGGIKLSGGETLPAPKKKPRSYGWLALIVGGVVAAIVLAVFLLHKPQQTDNIDKDSYEAEEVVEGKQDTLPSDDGNNGSNRVRPVNTPSPRPTATQDPQPPVNDYSTMSDYDLERRHNDPQALCELGKRKVRQNGTASIVLGINYLKKASNMGSADARQVLEAVYDRLENMAANGDSIAADILNQHR